MPELSGNLSGIRDSVKKRLLAMYDIKAGPDEFVPMELAAAMAEMTSLVRREIAVYLSRTGDVLDVSVGLSDSVSLQDFGLRRNLRRLSRVRCIHTHPNGDETLSDVDLAAITSLRLDAMCALGVDEQGGITGASLSFLAPDAGGMMKSGAIARLPLHALDDPRLMEAIANNDLMNVNPDEITGEESERAFLVSVDSLQSLEELAALADTAGARVVGQTLQAKAKQDPGTYVGSGKAAEIALEIQTTDANLLIADDELGGMQLKRLEEIVGVRVIDRTTLILDIFAQRATTSEGKLQVSLAQLNYQSGRLIGSRSALSRQAGGIGTRGPGESKLEMDRRVIKHRIQLLKDELKELERQRSTRRKNRQASEIPNVALVGYTNTGKSTLLNLLSGADVYVKDQLFATLDTVSRKVTLKERDEFLLTDSVGFISKLPTELVEAFRSTLDEALSADVLCVISDASNPQAATQRLVVEEVLRDLGACDQPRIEVYNKCDISAVQAFPAGALKVSAKTGEGIDLLLETIAEILRKRERTYMLFVPFSHYQVLGELRKQGRILQETHEADGTEVKIRLNTAAADRLRAQYNEVFKGQGA